MNPAAPKRKVDILHLVAVIAGAVAGIAGGQHFASETRLPCPICPVCPEVVQVAPVAPPVLIREADTTKGEIIP